MWFDDCLQESLRNQQFPLAEFARNAVRSRLGCENGSRAMKKNIPVESAAVLIDERIAELGDWRGKMLAKVRDVIHKADRGIIEEWKWGIPVFSHDGIVCTGEVYKNHVKMTFAKGAALQDPDGLFNSSLEGNIRRAIDVHEGEKVDEAALKSLIREAVALNVHMKSKSKAKPKARRAASPR
jgi:hypothetical protein